MTDLEKLIAARKMRTHCITWSVDEILDELIALDKKYGPLVRVDHKSAINLRDVLPPPAGMED